MTALYQENYLRPKEVSTRKKILDPRASFLQFWNKIFVLACIISVAIDPLFFCIPVVDNKRKCLDLDSSLKIHISVLRSLTDLCYIYHIILQFRTGFIAPSSRVFGRDEVIEDALRIAKQYLLPHFLIDILALLPLPQQVVGALWYLITVFRLDNCWREACKDIKNCVLDHLCCVKQGNGNAQFLNSSCPLLKTEDIQEGDFDFGIFLDALQSRVVGKRCFWSKLSYCFWWGMRNLSSLGQDLKTSNYVWETLFAIFICCYNVTDY